MVHTKRVLVTTPENFGKCPMMKRFNKAFNLAKIAPLSVLMPKNMEREFLTSTINPSKKMKSFVIPDQQKMGRFKFQLRKIGCKLYDNSELWKVARFATCFR